MLERLFTGGTVQKYQFAEQKFFDDLVVQRVDKGCIFVEKKCGKEVFLLMLSDDEIELILSIREGKASDILLVLHSTFIFLKPS